MRPRKPEHQRAQADLVEVVAAEGVSDERVLDALRQVPRAAFVPAALRDLAYTDVPLPIPHGQVTTQPSLIAKMVEALDVRAEDKVLEIGTGYGFQTALLAHLAGFVWSVERWFDIAKTARENLVAERIENAVVVVGDGTEGLAEQAPFEAILVSAAFPNVPQPLVDQLGFGGRLVQPIGAGGAEAVALFVKEQGGLVRRETVTGAHFVRLYGRHGFRP